MLTIFTIVVLFFSIVIHEIAHGSMALHLGDTTAKNEGRLSLNPIRHIDILGTIILPLLLLISTRGQGPIIGWAKPVPVNPFNFRDQKWGNLKVAIAGPATNFLLALVFGLIIRFIPLSQNLLNLFAIIVIYNFAWAIFNLIPLPPFDGSHILFSFLGEKYIKIKLFLNQYGFFILIFLIFFGGLSWIFQAANFLFAILIS